MGIELGGRWRKVVVGAGLLAVAFMVGCGQPLGQAGTARLYEARALVERGDYAEGERVLSAFLTEYGGTTAAGEAFYLRGYCRRHINPTDDAGAAADFAEAAESGSNPVVRRLAKVGLGHTYFERHTHGYYLKAIEVYEGVLAELPDGEPPKDAVLLRLGVAMQNVGRWPAADGYLSRCMSGFPGSRFSDTARRRFGARTFRLQVDAFSDLDHALQKCVDLRTAGQEADWSSIKRGGRMLYAVRSGEYHTYEEARQALRKFREGAEGAIIVAAELPKYGR